MPRSGYVFAKPQHQRRLVDISGCMAAATECQIERKAVSPNMSTLFAVCPHEAASTCETAALAFSLHCFIQVVVPGARGGQETDADGE